METTTFKTYALPPRFYLDHVARDLPSGRIVRTRSNCVTVELTGLEYDDLLGDAEFYSDPGIAADMGLRGLAASARRTAEILRSDPHPRSHEVQG